jgi:hypothetical protein
MNRLGDEPSIPRGASPMQVSRARRAPSAPALLTAVFLAGCSGAATHAGPAVPDAAPQGAHVYRPMHLAGGGLSVWPAGFVPHVLRPAWMKAAPAGNKGHVAVAQFGATEVLWYPKNDRKDGAPTACEPASSTNGIGVDAAGNLWIPDGRSDSTTEYGPDCGAAKLTIPDPTGEPAAIGFDRKGAVYILNINDISGPPTVNVYDASGNLLRTLGDPSFGVLFGVASDGNGNVFVSNQQSNNAGTVVEFPKGKMPGTVLPGVRLGLPGAPAFDKANNLIITDWEAETIDVFAPPYSGAPSTSPLKGSSIWCPLSRNEKQILCGDADFGAIDVYAYPGGTYLYSYTSALSSSAFVTGVAPSPAAPL